MPQRPRYTYPAGRWRTYGLTVQHHGHRQHHAAKLQQCTGYHLRSGLYGSHAHQNVFPHPTRKPGHSHGHLCRTELRRRTACARVAGRKKCHYYHDGLCHTDELTALDSGRAVCPAFVDAHEVDILQKTALFIHVSVSFYPMLGMLCILRYTIQGVGYTSLAMLSGVSEMFARIAVSVIAVPLWGYTAVCFGDSMAWVCAVLFLAPAFHYVYRRMTRLSPPHRLKRFKPMRL